METTERSVKEYITPDERNHFRIWHGGVKDKKTQGKDIKKAKIFWKNYKEGA